MLDVDTEIERNRLMATTREQEDPNYSENVQKALNKLISEEWLAGSTYTLFASALDRTDRNLRAVKDAFLETAVDETDDHMKSMIEFALAYGYDIPSTFSEFKKYADKEDVKLFEGFKKNKDSSYYLELAIKAEERAIKSYENVINSLDELAVLVELQAILKNNYYDEVEHLEDFNFLKYTIDAQLDYGSEDED